MKGCLTGLTLHKGRSPTAHILKSSSAWYDGAGLPDVARIEFSHFESSEQAQKGPIHRNIVNYGSLKGTG